MVEEEDIPIHNRPRVQAWAASNLGSLSRPSLGSPERDEMLTDARRLEKDADILYEKMKDLRKEAELLREQAYQKRVICAPIRSLPPETLSRILLLATPDSFAFHAFNHTTCHPLYPVSREWRDIIKTTPEFYSRINIVANYPILDKTVRSAESRLRSWLSHARSTPGLIINFHLQGLIPTNRSFYSSGPLHAIWLLLLDLVGNWREFSYMGASPSPFIHQFWEKASSARWLEKLSLSANDFPSHASTNALVLKPFICSLDLPRLQSLLLSGYFPADFIIHQLPSATSLQTLTLRNITSFSKDGLAGIAIPFPFLTKLRLEDVFPGSVELPNAPPARFQHLEHFELSHSLEYGIVALPALHGCRTLKNLRLQYSAFHLHNNYARLPSVERLELELGNLPPNPARLEMLYAILPSLKFLKVSPAAVISSGGNCDAGYLLLNLYVPEETNGRPPCPDLERLVLERARIPFCDIVCFIAGRTFNATPAAVKYLEEYGEDYYEMDRYRNTRYEEWKPQCLVTLSNCPGAKDMVDVGLHALIDLVKSGELILDNPDEDGGMR